MLIERERLDDAEFFHDKLAGAVGEAPLFVGVAAKDLPGLLDVVFSEIVNNCQRSIKKLLAERQCKGLMPPRFEKRQGFIYDKIRRQQRLLVSQ